MNNSILAIFSFLTAMGIAVYAIPAIIKVARIKRLYDKPGGRKGERKYIPNLGGIAILSAFLIAFLGWADVPEPGPEIARFQYLVVGAFVLLFIGIKDDLVPLPALKKFSGQLLAAAILVIPGKFRLTDLYGILGIHHLPILTSILISIFAVVLLINAFNLIDGIDGLAGGLGFLLSLTFSLIFWTNGRFNMFVGTMALAGALGGFLIYNKPPARIFMGDTGSMCIGYLMAAFTFLFVQTGGTNRAESLFHHHPVVAIAFLIIPLFDTLRVFTIRVLRKKSPFAADRGHIHHKLLDLGLSHGQATITLCLVNLFFIGLAYFMKDVNPNLFVVLTIGAAILLTGILMIILRKRKSKARGMVLLSRLHVKPFVNKELKREVVPTHIKQVADRKLLKGSEEEVVLEK